MTETLEEVAQEIHERLIRNPVKKLELDISTNGRSYKIIRHIGEYTGTTRGKLTNAVRLEEVRNSILPRIPQNYTASIRYGVAKHIYLTIIPKSR